MTTAAVSNWKEGRLGEYIKVQGGFAFKSDDFCVSGIPVVKIKNVRTRYIDLQETDFVSEDIASSARDYFLENGDVVISMTGSGPNAPNSVVGRIARYTGSNSQCLINQRVGRFLVRSAQEIEKRFLFFLLSQQEVQNLLVSNSTGSANQANISNAQIESLEFVFPPLPEQKAIAAILGALDDKIELNRRTNATLEAIARALFKSWFVDFDPVRAKSEGRQPFGMDAETAALFSSRLVPSTLGDIPEGWTAGTLGNVADNPRTVVQPHELSSETPYIGLEHMPRRCIALTEWGQADDVTSHKSAFARGDFLFGKLRPYFHKVGIAAIDGIASTDIAVVRATQKEFYAFALSVISSDVFVDYTNQLSNGAKMPRINWADMAKYELVLPPPQIARAYNAIIAPMLNQIIANIHESRKLSNLRDYLLPKLISGDIRIPGAEKFLEAA